MTAVLATRNVEGAVLSNRTVGTANSNAAPTAPVRPAGPVRWRLALLTLIGVYPVITAYLYILMPLTGGWKTWQRTLLLAPLMIVSIVYGIAPLLQKHFGWFLRPRPRR